MVQVAILNEFSLLKKVWLNSVYLIKFCLSSLLLITHCVAENKSALSYKMYGPQRAPRNETAFGDLNGFFRADQTELATILCYRFSFQVDWLWKHAALWKVQVSLY